MNAKTTDHANNRASRVIALRIKGTLKDLQREVESRAYRASNELRNASLYVLRGQRTGQRYKIPGTYRRQRDKATGKMKNGKYYTASAPGESPANRTGIFRLSWGTNVRIEQHGTHYRAVSAIESNIKVGKYLLGELLEYGTRHMKERPYKQEIRDRAYPNILAIYKKSYKD